MIDDVPIEPGPNQRLGLDKLLKYGSQIPAGLYKYAPRRVGDIDDERIPGRGRQHRAENKTPVVDEGSVEVAEYRDVRRPRARGKFSLGDFSFRYVLGQGGFGLVHLAQCKRDGKYYAVKSQKKSEAIKHVESANREVIIQQNVAGRSAGHLVAGIRGTFQDVNYLFMVLDLEAGDLSQVIKSLGMMLTEESARFYALEMLCALHYLHAQSIAHLDVKPGNFLVTAKGHLRISDFGLATDFANKPIVGGCGTYAYMAPEQYLGRPYTTGPDWFAFGVTVFEMLAGAHPWPRDWKLFQDKRLSPAGYADIVSRGPRRWPPHISSKAKAFLRSILEADQTRRLGFYRSDEVRKHPWLVKDYLPDFYNHKKRAVPTILPMNYNWYRRDGRERAYGLRGFDKYGHKFVH